MKTALLSVYDKTGIVEFAQELVSLGWQLLASGGTAEALVAGGVPVKDLAEIVGPPILGHKVVTLSREVHAGLLASDLEIEELERLSLRRIDLVCVYLYPLQAEIAKPGSTLASVTGKTDIGGPTMLRSAAKGRRIVIGDPADRGRVLEWLQSGQPNEIEYLEELAGKAEMIAAAYGLASARYISKGKYDGMVGELFRTCAYGENAWQSDAALYSAGGDDPLALNRFELVAGAPPSYNNYCDLDRLLQTASHLAAGYSLNFSGTPLLAVGVKHGNACGAAITIRPISAVEGMIDGDPQAIFGGLVLLNFPVDNGIAERLLEYRMPAGKRRVLDGIVAPNFTADAVERLRRKGDKCRFLANPALLYLEHISLDTAPRFRQTRGGFLKQPNYTYVLDFSDARLLKTDVLTAEQRRDLLLAWAVGATSNSNTITLVRDGKLLGNAVGQPARVDACRLAVARAAAAGHNLLQARAYSDSFFPFPDGPEVLYRAGVNTILASSGSIRDAEVRAACQANGVDLCLIPDAVGRGFFGH